MRSGSWAWARWWSAAALVVALYAGYYASLIARHTAVPYFDQANYVSRVYHIAERVERDGLLRVEAYLGGAYSTRPPLLLAPAAWIWGQDARPQAVARLWLGIRLGVLLAALALLARVIGSARFAPLALLVTLGGGFFLQIEPHLYLMDQPFACFGMLVFAALIWALTSPGPVPVLALGASSLMLFLVKPAGLIFAAVPLLLALLRGSAWTMRNLRRRQRRMATLAWAAAWALFAVGLLAIVRSSYWRSAMELWREGWRGWWSFPRANERIWQFAVLLLPGWLALLAAAALVRMARGARAAGRPFAAVLRERTGLAAPAAAGGFATLAAWYVYTVWVNFSADERFPAGALPAGAALLAIVVCSDRRLEAPAHAIATILFAANLAMAVRLDRPPALERWQALTGVLARRAQPVAEIGLVPVARAVLDETARRRPSGGTSVCVLVCDDYFDFAAMALAARYAAGNRWPPVRWSYVSWHSEDFDLAAIAEDRFFLTKAPRSTIVLNGDPFAGLRAMERLVGDHASPLRAKVQALRTMHVRQPAVPPVGLFDRQPPFTLTDQTVVLWQLQAPLTAAELARGMRYVEGEFRNTSGYAEVRRRLAEYESRFAAGPPEAGGYATPPPPAAAPAAHAKGRGRSTQ